MKYFFRQNFLPFVGFSFLSLLFIVLGLREEMFENGVYYHYLQSILSTFDFNLLSELTNEFDLWMVSQTYNHFDYHSPYISSLLFLPELMTRLFSLFVTSRPVLEILPFFTFFLSSTLSILILWNIDTGLGKGYNKAVLFFIFSSVSLWYYFFDPTEISLLCAPLGLFIFSKVFLSAEKTSSKDSLFVGMSLGAFMLIKPDGTLWFLGVLLFYFFKKNWKGLSWVFTFGLTSLLISFFTDLVRFGWPLPNQISTVMSWEFFSIGSMLFGPVGVFWLSPIFFVFILGCFCGLFSKDQKVFNASMFCLFIFFLKSILISLFFLESIDSIASRNYISGVPLWAYGVYLFYKSFPRLAIALCLFSFIVNIYHVDLIFRFFSISTELNYFEPRIPFAFTGFFDGVMDFQSFYYDRLFKLIPSFFFSIAFLSLFFGAILLIFSLILSRYKNNFYDVFITKVWLIIAVFFSMNLFFNQRNAEEIVASGKIDQSVVAKSDALIYDEVIDLIELELKHRERRGRKDINDVLEYKSWYLKKVPDNIVKDPIGFVEGLEKGIVRPSFWRLKYGED